MCIELSKYRSHISSYQNIGATSLSSLQDTQRKLKKDITIERFATNKFQSTSPVKNGLSTSIIEVEIETKSEGGSNVGEKTAIGAKLQNMAQKIASKSFGRTFEGAEEFFMGTKLKLL